MSNDTIIYALTSALEHSPDDVNLRLHLAEILLTNEDYPAAIEHFEGVLKLQPANVKALNGAAQCALNLEQRPKAEGYQHLLAALGQSIETQKTDNVSTFPAPENSISANKTDASDQDQSAPQKLKVVEDTSNITIGPWEDFQAPITLADVGGMESVKKRLNMAFLAPLKNPEIMKLYGKTLNGGLMLYGPPGCGKTYIARALAGELNATFLSVSLSDVLDMWVGESERKLHEIFEAARRKAPAVLFFDEIDALGQKRSQLKNSGGRNIVNQLLAEMDSVENDNKDVFMLAATNHPWDVDTALRRPGRFDRVTLVLPPDVEARKAILELHLRDRPAENIDSAQLAQKTPYYSGADLAHLCESAAEYAIEEAIESGHARPLSMSDFTKALNDINHSTRPWFDTAKNYALFANEGGTYDELLDYLNAEKI